MRTSTDEKCYASKFKRLLAFLASCALLYQNACSVVGANKLFRLLRLRQTQWGRFQPLQSQGGRSQEGTSRGGVFCAGRMQTWIVIEFLKYGQRAFQPSETHSFVVRLQGPHHGGTHRVQIVGLDEAGLSRYLVRASRAALRADEESSAAVARDIVACSRGQAGSGAEEDAVMP